MFGSLFIYESFRIEKQNKEYLLYFNIVSTTSLPYYNYYDKHVVYHFASKNYQIIIVKAIFNESPILLLIIVSMPCHRVTACK